MRATTTFAICLGVLTLGLLPAAAAAENSPYTRSLSRLDSALRFAIERQPEGLAKSIATSERVCELGQGADARGDVAAAAADWSTLSQTVELLDEPGLARVERAFRTATRTLAQVESTFADAWRDQPARVRELRRGAKAVRLGIRQLTGSFTNLRAAFTAWRERRCEAALSSLDSFAAEIPDGVDSIGRGVERLWLVSLGG